jgi:DnaJ-class molecular chaperone
MTRIVFGRDRVCGTCNGSGGEHRYHVETVGYQQGEDGEKSKPIRKHVPCAEHPCPRCKGAGLVAV